LDDVKDLDLRVNVNRITHVRIIDVIGALEDEWAGYDSLGNKINDPWPTPFEAGGFDLDAVGVRHQKTLNADVNGDGIVDYRDFARLAATDTGGFAVSADMIKLLEEWLCTEPWYEFP
jgi:hypothetical protein